MTMEAIKEEFYQEIALVKTSRDLEQLKHQFLSKKGPLQALYKSLKDVAPSERRAFGQKGMFGKRKVSSLYEEI